MDVEAFSTAARVTIVAAHPDDEVIGAGAQLPALAKRLSIVYLTDGAPFNLADTHNAGFETREAYADARRREAEAAAALAGIRPGQLHWMETPDQTASHNLAAGARAVLAQIERLRPNLVLTHAYEGGHPDHDAAAFATHAAAALSSTPPEIWEFTSYHAGPAGMVTGEFLPYSGVQVQTQPLTAEQRELKRRMFASFATQQHVLAQFVLDAERFRQAPAYDFTGLPHAGRLYYENFDWGMTGSRFCELAAAALDLLGVDRHHATHHS